LGDQSAWRVALPGDPTWELGRDVDLDVWIEDDDSGFLLLCSTRDRDLYFDTWHRTIEEARAAAAEVLGLKASDWDS
jgi:hypothetical protein